MDMDVRIVTWKPGEKNEVAEAFLQRKAFDESAETAAREVLAGIRAEGDRAVVKYAAEFDGAELKPAEFQVRNSEFVEAREAVDEAFKIAVREAHKRIAAFARSGLRKNWSISTPRGGNVGEQFGPLDRVGVYVPGGAAPLASTVLMTVALAKAAEVPEIVACTPCDRKGRVNPYLLYALETAGATEVYRVGGIQAIGLMAYGTGTVRKVQKIVGPGGTYVTAAKRQVYGEVALDLVAGPSEIAVLADDTADARYIAADLLSQAEHGTGFEKALLVTSSMNVAVAVQEQLKIQVEKLSRREVAGRVMEKGMLLIVAHTLDEGMDVCNRFAPEHLEIMVSEPKSWLKKVRRAGAIFIGAWSPESTGDFVAGPSHVLPTGGSAAMFSGLTVDDFRRRSSFVAFTRADLQDALPCIESFGRVEGLDGHVRSAQVRFDRK